MGVFVPTSKEGGIFSYNLFCNLNIKDMKPVAKKHNKYFLHFDKVSTGCAGQFHQHFGANAPVVILRCL
jgi:hypothetical protein